MTADPRILAARSARADAQRRFVVQHGVVAPQHSSRSIALRSASIGVLSRMAPLRRFDRTTAQTIIIAAGFGLGIVEHDGADGFRVVDQYKLGSASHE